MSRYRVVDVRIWNDAKFKSLPDHSKLVFLFLLTHPHMTSVGAMRATLVGLAAELGWTAERFQEAFAEPFAKGLVKADEMAAFVCLPNFVKFNKPANPNVVKSWSKVVDLIPECELQREHFHRVGEVVAAMGKGFREALPEPFLEPFAKGMANQEQEQEQEQDQEQDDSSVMGDAVVEAIYAAYPRKANRGAAIQAIRAALGKTDAGELREAVEAYAAAVAKWPEDQRKFIPHAATWFANERWTDDRTEWQRRDPRADDLARTMPGGVDF